MPKTTKQIYDEHTRKEVDYIEEAENGSTASRLS